VDEGLNASALARHEGVSSAYVTRVARLAMLSPRLVDEIISGSHGAMLNASRLLQMSELPVSWKEQEKLVRSLG
jgi:site-specific DNA recombinase